MTNKLNNKNISVILTTTPSIKGYSLESGLSDQVRHFDHHSKEHKELGHKSPCNTVEMPVIPNDSVIQISHIDSDTFIGIERMCGIVREGLDYDLMEQIDLNGSSVSPDLFDKTLLFMVGLSTKTRDMRFPRSNKDIDVSVTQYISNLIDLPTDYFIELGYKTQVDSLTNFSRCLINSVTSITGLEVAQVVVPDNISVDPSIGYSKGFDIIVVYRENYKSISLYGKPNSNFELNKNWSGIEFQGHTLACGSPRGVDHTVQDSDNVLNSLSKI